MGNVVEIGKAVANVVRPTDSSPRSVKCPAVTDRDLQMPTTDAEARELAEWARSQPLTPPVTMEQLGRHLAYMQVALPSRAMDTDAGRMRTAVYARLLGGYTNDALAFMARTACTTLDWFPTPHQCLEILKGYTPPISASERALRLCSSYSQARFEEWLARLSAGEMSQSEVDAANERWRKIAWERGLLRLDGNRLVIREQKDQA